MRKTFKVLIASVVVIWLFSAGLVTGTFMMRNKYKKMLEQTTAPQIAQTEPTKQGIQIDIITDVAPVTTMTTQAFSFEMPTNGGNISTYGSSSEKQLAVPSGDKEIAQALIKAINTTKALKSFNAVKQEKTDFTVDSVTGGSAVKSAAEDMINKYGNKPVTEYSFSNGKDNNGSAESPSSVLPPKNATASVSESAIKSASAQQNSSGGYDIVLVLNDETQTPSQKASNHDGLFDTLDISSLSLPSGFKVAKADFTYSSAQIKASVNSDGRLDLIEYTLPISKGDIGGTMLSANVAVSLRGTYTSSVSFTYL